MAAPKEEIKTSDKIRQVARDLFLEKGFSSVSIRDIAKKADVPISLIYHYYDNKIGLWKEVKKSFLEKYFESAGQGSSLEFSSWREFLTYTMTLRFNFYAQDPNIARLISWQRLESSKESLGGINVSTLISDLTPYIVSFQKKGEIRKDLDSEMISYLITTVSSAPFFDNPQFMQQDFSEEKKAEYLKMIIESVSRLCAL